MMQKNLYTINSICSLIVLLILSGAFFFQFGLGEEPCPLCLLQRMAMLGMVFGISLNTWYGFKKEHFSVVIVSALVGVTFSIRQVLLHIAPVVGEPTGYGTAVLGMHLYTWATLVFAASILSSAILLAPVKEEDNSERVPDTFEKNVFYFAIFICAANLVAAFFECGLGPCCENGPCLIT